MWPEYMQHHYYAHYYSFFYGSDVVRSMRAGYNRCAKTPAELTEEEKRRNAEIDAKRAAKKAARKAAKRQEAAR